MSKAYDIYLNEHIKAVKKAGRWMADHLASVDELSDDELEDFLLALANHDYSKYDQVEYIPYDSYFYGKRNDDSFNIAWLHHIHHNAHHWQHWLLMQDDGKYREAGKIVALEMPRVYALEMVADWWSFSWRSGNLLEVFKWYGQHADCMVLHDKTRQYIEVVLDEIRNVLEAGEDA